MSTENTHKPVAWQARGYSQFRTGNPGPWRFFGGPTKPTLNKPEECDIEPLFDQATIDAAVAKERERLRMLVEAIRDANCDAEDVNTFRLLKPGQERAWLALMAGLKG